MSYRLCNNINPTQGTQAKVQARCESFIQIQVVDQYPVKVFQHRDCLGMTPLHILLCSYYDMRVLECMIEKCPDAVLIQDKWGEVPLD